MNCTSKQGMVVLLFCRCLPSENLKKVARIQNYGILKCKQKSVWYSDNQYTKTKVPLGFRMPVLLVQNIHDTLR